MRIRYPEEIFQFETPADEPCTCSCHEEYYENLSQLEAEGEFPDEY